MEFEIETLFIGMIRHSSKAFSKSKSITMITSWAYLSTASNGIPSCICPFYCRFITHFKLQTCFTLFKTYVQFPNTGLVVSEHAFLHLSFYYPTFVK